ncbi:MAG TPA: S53 family peptidase, partial [Chloroflexota bacterium]|nr:S53 family peptidase [Chloroflexota bacterium]
MVRQIIERRIISRFVVNLAIAAALISTQSTSTVSTASSAPTVTVPGHVPAFTSRATRLSRLPADQQLSLTVALRPRSTTALTDAVALSQSRAPRRLTVDELGAAIGQSAMNIDALTSYFRAQGLSVEPVVPDRLSFRVSGRVSRLEPLFAIELANYEDSAGHLFFSTDRDPSLPADLASSVQAIYGLDDYPALRPFNQRVTNSNPAFYTPADMRTAYDVNPLYTVGFNGSGQTIGILGCYTFLDSDIAGFETSYGMPNASITRVKVDGGAITSDPEPTIDVEWSLAIAPNASIIYYGFSDVVNPGACSFSSLYDAVVRVGSDNQASIVSISFGACEDDFASFGYLQGMENQFQASAALGQSIFVSSGDSGATNPPDCPGLSVSYPASSAYVTATGGTSLYTTSNGTYLSESAWGSPTSCNGKPCGTGGGISHDIPEPSWQSAAPILSTNGFRGLSDIAWNSDPNTGNVLYLTGFGCNGLCCCFGGTSIAAPQWAGVAAIADQAGGTRLGQLAPLLYSPAARS